MIGATIDDNLERIRSDLAGRGLTCQRLLDDVLDHVCCMVEEKMHAGEDFESSYGAVLDSIGENRLPELQHQTLLNLDKKFQRMKNFTYIFGLSSALVTLLGAFFKRMHWPGAGILLTVGIVLIVLVFLPLYFVTNYREQAEKKNPVYPVVGYLTLALLLAGALFKIMHWPGAGSMVLLGTGFLIVGFVPLYVVNAFRRAGKQKVALPYVVMLLVGIAIITLFANVNMSKTSLELYREEAVQNEASVQQVRERTAALLELAGDSVTADRQGSIARIHEQARSLQVRIEAMQDEMISLVGEPGAFIGDVQAIDNRRAGDQVISKDGAGREFDLEANIFREMLEEMIDDPVVRGQIGDHLEFTGKIWKIEYGAGHVLNEPLVKNYYKLSDAAKGIALAEYVAIRNLLGN
ncbi:MAG TPA: hypothetical protein ENO20_02920 [Bacteroides sp.]|nr:hypothetical protein [Bacteroides sp.]